MRQSKTVQNGGRDMCPMMESTLRKGLTYSKNGFATFLTCPVSLILLLISVGSLAWPFIRDRRDAKRKASGMESEVDKMSNVFDVEED